MSSQNDRGSSSRTIRPVDRVLTSHGSDTGKSEALPLFLPSSSPESYMDKEDGSEVEIIDEPKEKTI